MAETVLGVLVSGRGSNLQAILDAINGGHLPVSIGVVISDNPKAQALARLSGTNIAAACIERQQFTSRDQFETALADTLEQYGVNLVVLAGFMRLLGPVFIQRYRGRVINIHPSLLPAFPGLNAQEQALRYGVKISGCTVHFVDEGMDTGPIILQQPVPVMDDDTVQSLSERILIQEHLLYPKAIALIAAGKVHIDGRRVKLSVGEERK